MDDLGPVVLGCSALPGAMADGLTGIPLQPLADFQARRSGHPGAEPEDLARHCFIRGAGKELDSLCGITHLSI